MPHVIPALANDRTESVRSCASCKFFTPPARATQWALAQPGTCAAYGGRPTDLTTMSESEVKRSHEVHAEKCPKYNENLPASKTADFIQVAIPIGYDADKELSSVAKNACTSCEACVNFVGQNHPDVELRGITQELGLAPGTGLCAARGGMIKFGQPAMRVAAKCEYRQAVATVGQEPLVKNRQDLGNLLTMYPKYNLPVFRDKYMIEQTAGGLPTDYDPDSYVKGVTPRADGVAGWVTISDPSGTGNTIKLPVFGDGFFSDEESHKIPRSTDDERPDLYIDWEGLVYTVGVAWFLNETPTLIGQPGVGKTELFRHLAWAMRIPFERISITGSTELDDLQGNMQFLDGETKFKYGRVPLAWEKPCVLLIDEPNVGPREVWQFLRPLTDNSKQLVIDAADGVPIKRNDHCYFGFAMNPQWDVKNDGTIELADADIRRLFHVWVGYPELDTEATIIRNHCRINQFDIPDQLLDWVQRVGASLRVLAKELPISWGLGQQIKVAKLLQWFPPVQAYNLAAGNYLDPDVRQTFLAEVIATYPRA
jgi:hypothetical protein